jgi:hypothetical protein
LKDIALACFPSTLPLVSALSYNKVAYPKGAIVGFGQGWGGELRLPGRGRKGGYSVDWILAQVQPNGDLEKFVAVEVQTIDTTGSYKTAQRALMSGMNAGQSKTGFNWENVNKRILPQLIYKGHILRREQLCGSGLFFVCPEQIFDSMVERLGGLDNLEPYPQRPGTITFMPYTVQREIPAPGTRRPLMLVSNKIRTTTIEQIEMAFSSAKNLPEGGVYERAIRVALPTMGTET